MFRYVVGIDRGGVTVDSSSKISKEEMLLEVKEISEEFDYGIYFFQKVNVYTVLGDEYTIVYSPVEINTGKILNYAQNSDDGVYVSLQKLTSLIKESSNKVDKLIEKLEKLTGKKVKLKEASSSTKFELTSKGKSLVADYKQLHSALVRLGVEDDFELGDDAMDAQTVYGAAVVLKDINSLKPYFTLDEIIDIEGDEEFVEKTLIPLYLRRGYIKQVTTENVKLTEVAKTFKKDIGLSKSFDEFREIDSLLRKAGFKASTIEDTVRGIVDETLDYYWWIARGDDMPHGITINNPKIFKTKMYNALLDYQGESEY